MKNNKKPVGADAHIRPAPKEYQNNRGITLIALVVTIIVLLILAGLSLSLVAGGNGIIGKAAKAVDATTESMAVEEVELVIAEANMEYYLDDTVTNETLIQYLVKKFSPYTTGSGAQITFNEDRTIEYEAANGDVILMEMQENGKVEIISRADGSTIERTVIYNANGGTGSVPVMQTYERNATVNVDFSVLPTRVGYVFLGWARNASATVAEYTSAKSNSFTMGASNITLYAVWSNKAVDMINPENYGDGVNYTANDINDWKVFLNDGSNVYLIASDYVPRSKLTLTSDVATGDGDYCVYGTSRDKLLSWLTTSSNWSNFANGTSGGNSMTGAVATGGPILSQFWESYNKKYGTSYSADEQDLSSHAGYNDMLYFPHNEKWNSCEGYWLASPHSSHTNRVGDVHCTSQVVGNFYWGTYLGVRPLVQLPTGVKVTRGSDGKWTFTN